MGALGARPGHLTTGGRLARGAEEKQVARRQAREGLGSEAVDGWQGNELEPVGIEKRAFEIRFGRGESADRASLLKDAEVVVVVAFRFDGDVAMGVARQRTIDIEQRAVAHAPLVLVGEADSGGRARAKTRNPRQDAREVHG